MVLLIGIQARGMTFIVTFIFIHFKPCDVNMYVLPPVSYVCKKKNAHPLRKLSKCIQVIIKKHTLSNFTLGSALVSVEKI